MKKLWIGRSNFALSLCVATYLALSASRVLAGDSPVDAKLRSLTHARAVAAIQANPRLERNPYAVLVKFRPDATEDTRRRARNAAAVTPLVRYSLVPGLELVRVTGSPEAAVASLKAQPGVAYAELDVVVRAAQAPGRRLPLEATAPNGTFFYSWGMDNWGQTVNGVACTPGADVNAPEAWFVTIGDPNFVVAIIDTGVQYTHPNLAANIWTNPGEIAENGLDDDGNGYVDDVRGWDFYAADNDPMDENGHGTHTAGTVGAVANNVTETSPGGVVGMMWECKLMPLRFLGPAGNGLMSDAALAVQYAAQKGVKVSNNSYGYGTGSVIQSFYDAINAAKSAGHIFVAAAGNGGSDGIGDNNDGNKKYYPASYNLDNIIAVAATDMHDQLASFSNYGATNVDLAAPGVYILSTYLLDWGGPGYTQRYLNGTSMAAPHVAGAAGLVYCQNPGWTYQQVRQQIISTARPVPSLAGKTVSGGVLNAAAALGVVFPAPPAVPGTPTLTKPAAGQVRIAWADNSSNETGFRVQREKKSGKSWGGQTTVATTGADVTAVIDTPGTGTFRYRVQAFNDAGASAWTAWVQITN